MTNIRRTVYLSLILGLLILSWALAPAVTWDSKSPSSTGPRRAAAQAVAHHPARQAQITVSVSAQLLTDTVPVGQVFTVTVNAAQLETPLSAFQFDLSYDPDVIAYLGSSQGEFLASTGRAIVCPNPAQPAGGTVRMACASTGPQNGSIGEGPLAALTFLALNDGQSELTLSGVQLPDDESPPALIETTLRDGRVSVGTGESEIYLPLIMRGSASKRAGGTMGLTLALLSLLGFPALILLAGRRTEDERRRTRRLTGWHRLCSYLTILSILASSVPLVPVRAAPAASLRPEPAPATVALSSQPSHSHTLSGDGWADLDGDQDVDSGDLALMAEHWNCATDQPCYEATYDRDGDGDIDALDLAHLGNQYDIEPPELEITSPPEGAVVGGTALAVSGTISDAHDVEVSVNGVAAEVAEGLFSAAITLEGGNQTINVIATDELGAASAADRLVGVDATGPMIEVHAPSNRQSVYALRPTIAISYTDFYTDVDPATLEVALTPAGGSPVAVALSPGAEGASGTPNFDLAEDTAYTLTAALEDVLGNLGTVQTTFYVPTDPENITPPEEPAEAAWISGVVYDSTTCEGGQEQPISCDGLAGVQVTLAQADQPTATVSGVIVTGPDGFFAFPVAETGRYWLRAEKRDYTYGQREAELVRQRSTPVNEIYLTPLDSNHQLCDSGGCDLTSSDGMLRVQIPSGAITGTDEVDVSATFFEQVEFLPSGDLPEGTWETYGFNLGGDSEYEFTRPITVWVNNTLDFPANMSIPLGFWNQGVQEWEHAGTSWVDSSGEWVVFTTTHFSTYDCNDPMTLNDADIMLDDGSEKDKPCAEKDESGSAIILRSGVLRQEYTLPPVQVLGDSLAPTLLYDSSRADPSEVIEIEIGLGPVPGIELGDYVQAELFIEGEKTENFTFGVDDLAGGGALGYFRYLWDGRDGQGDQMPPGVYQYAVRVRIPYRAQYYYALDGVFGAPPDYVDGATGVYVNATAEEWLYGTVTLGAGSSGGFGLGWTLDGLHQLYEDEAGRFMIDDGRSVDEYYFPGKNLLGSGAYSDTSRLLQEELSGKGKPETTNPKSSSRPPGLASPLPVTGLRPPADTFTGGLIITHTTWTITGTPYVLTADVIVTRGVTLTVEPGVVVKGQDDTEVKVLGHLAALGTVTQPITFTSATDTGAAQWSGLVFDGSAVSEATLTTGGGTGDLRHATVRYGGDPNTILGEYAGSNIAVHNVLTGEVRLENCQVRDEALNWDDYGLHVSDSRVVVSGTLFGGNGEDGDDYALYATGADTIITVTGSVFENNVGWAMRVEADDAHRLTGNTFSGNGVDRILVAGGAVAAGAGLEPQTGLVGYELEDDLTVPAGITLTVEPGATLMGQSSSELLVQGHLQAIGTPSQPITFTSATNTGWDQWSGLVFDGSAGLGTGELRHATVRYGGDGNSILGSYVGSNITVQDVSTGAVCLESSEVRSSYYYGIFARESNLVISDTLFIGNGYSESYYPVNLKGNVSRLQIVGNTFQGNAQDRVWLRDISLSEDVALLPQTGMDGYFLDELIVQAGVALTIEPGVAFFGSDYGAGVTVHGHMDANGTVTEPIAFSGPGAFGGNFDGIEFDGAGASGLLSHVIVENTYTWIRDAAVSVINGASATLRDCEISGTFVHPGSSPGVRVTDGSTLTVEGGKIYANEAQGIYVVDSYATISGTLLANNHTAAYDPEGSDYYALDTLGDSFVTVTHALFQDNVDRPLRIPIASLSEMKDNLFVGNGENRIRLYGDGSLAADATLEIKGDVSDYEFNGSLTVPEGVTLTVEPGVGLYWDSNEGLTVEGSLHAVGTTERPITFTSISDYNPGQWEGIALSGSAVSKATLSTGSSACELEQVTIRYAVDGLTVNDGQAALRYTAIINSKYDGVHLTGAEARLSVTACDFSGNGSYGLRNESGFMVDARYTWWGHTSGPYHPTLNDTGLGDWVSDDVLFEPWLEETMDDLGIIKRTATDHTRPVYSPVESTYARHYPDGSAVYFDADDVHSYTLDAAGNKTSYVYNGDGSLAALQITPAGESDPRWIWSFAYSDGYLSSITDPAGRVTAFETDRHGNLVSITDPGGATITYAYDEAHRVTHKRDELGNLTTYTYNDYGRVQKLGRPPRAVYKIARGLTVEQETHTYTTSDVAYQLVNNMTPGKPDKPTDPLVTDEELVDEIQFGQGGYRAYTNKWGSTKRRVDGLGRPTRYEHDEADRVTKVTTPEGNCTAYTYDENGNLLSESRMGPEQCALDPDERDPTKVRTTRYTYEARFNQVKSRTGPLGHTTVYTYDYEIGQGEQGLLVAVQHPPVPIPETGFLGKNQDSVS